MIDKYVSEILEELENPDTQRDVLIKYQNNKTWMSYLGLTLSPSTHFDIKERIDYKPLRLHESPHKVGFGFIPMEDALRRSYLFISNHPKASPNLTLVKRMELLQDILEGLEEVEAEAYMNMILKKAPVDRQIVEETFPGWLK